ncbi:unnamed protein product [Rotaria sordida]|uniref:Uncharacterized protein n=2 Tax=Rotaria sordida TaxID=392033 RepID=A0A815LGB0_9BILA|nr:unnamed protein product [Rotaria sordida]
MNISKSDTDFVLDLFQHVPPSHVALFLRLIRLYPMNVVDDSMKREQTILAIINETISTDYKVSIWPKIMSINRIPELAEQVLLSNEHERLLSAIAKLQLRFELQPHRFLIHQLIPTWTTCFICHNRLDEPKFDEISSIITRENVYSCVMYKNECCDLIYKYGHVRNRRTRERFVTPDMIFNQKFLHLFDHVVYERQLLVAFTNLFHEAATSFQSYSNATNSNIDQNRNSNGESVTWTWFEICRYLFFMTDLTMIQIPDVIQRLSHDLYYEVNATFFYELFVKFWSHHNQVQSCQCQPKDKCMLNFVFDTHMKAHRLVCAYTSSCDESIPELGAVAVGCPRMPLRSSSALLKNMTSTKQDKCKQYCELHYKYGLELNMPQNLNIKKALELDQLAEEFDDNDICTVHRDNDDREHKRRTAGFMAIVSNCNVIIGWGESEHLIEPLDHCRPSNRNLSSQEISHQVCNDDGDEKKEHLIEPLDQCRLSNQYLFSQQTSHQVFNDDGDEKKCPNIWESHPIFVGRVYQLIAKLFDTPLRQIANQLLENIETFYHLP